MSIIYWVSINIVHSISLVESSLLKNQSPLDSVAHFNRAEVKKADNPVSGKDSVDSKKMDDGTCIKINPYRRAKGMVAHTMYSVTGTENYGRHD